MSPLDFGAGPATNGLLRATRKVTLADSCHRPPEAISWGWRGVGVVGAQARRAAAGAPGRGTRGSGATCLAVAGRVRPGVLPAGTVADMSRERDDALEILREALPELRRRFHVRSLRLFGSFARDDAGPTSDVDLLVEFAEPVGLFLLADLRRHLSTLLARPVDVGTEASLRPRVRRSVLEESIRVA
jgi:predicted nucleotidyltransferase